MGVTIRIRNGIIHLVSTTGGIRKEETTGLRTSPNKIQNRKVMELAEVLRSKKEIEIISGLNGLTKEGRKITLYDFVKNNLSISSESAVKALPYLEKFGAKTIILSTLNSNWYENFQQKMENESGLAQNTAEKYCCVVRQYLKKAVRDGLIAKNPADGIKHIKTPESKREALTEQEVKKMIDYIFRLPATPLDLQDEIRNGFLFAVFTGLRVSDLQSLTWQDIDDDKKQVVKRQKKTKTFVYIPLTDNALRCLPGRKADDEKVFPLLAKSQTSTNRYISKWATAAGVKKHVTWHIARHTDATLLIENGVDIYTVQKLLGHTDISTTMQYAKVSDKKKREAVEKIPDFF